MEEAAVVIKVTTTIRVNIHNVVRINISITILERTYWCPAHGNTHHSWSKCRRNPKNGGDFYPEDADFSPQPNQQQSYQQQPSGQNPQTSGRGGTGRGGAGRQR